MPIDETLNAFNDDEADTADPTGFTMQESETPEWRTLMNGPGGED